MDILIKILVTLLVIVLCAALEEAVSRASARVTVRVFPLVILKPTDVKVTALWDESITGVAYAGLDWVSNVSGGNSTQPIDGERSVEWTVPHVPPVDTWFVVTLYSGDAHPKVLATGRALVTGPEDK